MVIKAINTQNASPSNYFATFYYYLNSLRLMYLYRKMLYGDARLHIPALCSVTSRWEVEIGHPGSIYTMEISNPNKRKLLPAAPKSSFLNIH